RRCGAWLAIALVTGSQLLVGYPVAIAYCWLIAAPYAVWTARSRGELAPLAAVASAIATGVLLGAIQLLPTYDYLMTSERADPSYEYLTEMSLHPLHLLSAVAPWLFRNHLFMEGRHEPLERAFYFGPVVPIAALWIALRWRALGEWRALVAGLAARGRRAALFALIPLVLADQAAYAAAQWWVDPPCTIAEWRDRVLPRPVDPPLRVTTPKSY